MALEGGTSEVYRARGKSDLAGGGGCRSGPDGVRLSRSGVVGRLIFAGMVVMAAATFWFVQRVFFPGGMA